MAFGTVINTPLERKGARTPDEYREIQRRIIARNRKARPTMPWSDPFISDLRPEVYIGAGTWLVRCVCGDCATVHPVWRLACCCFCGAIYEDLAIPDEADAIAAVLLKRSNPTTRNWKAPETVSDLRAQNLAHGEPV